MKKFVTLAFLLAAFACATNAFAVGLSFEELYPVADKFSTDEQTTFGWDEKPWIYVKLPDIGYKFDITGSFWRDPSEDGSSSLHLANLIKRDNSDNEIWFSFKDNYWFGTKKSEGIREAGEWDINVCSLIFSKCFPQLLSATTSLTVVPEPISSGLFLLGSGILGITLFRKKKKVS